jgi:Spy/CpxP family protein refolding chaperone
MKNIALLLFLVSLGINAQERKYEKIKAHKTAFITEKLDLTPSEAEKFWPIYNQHEKEVQKLRKKERTEVFGKLKENGADALSDAEANSLIESHLAMKTQMLEKEKKLIKTMRGVISPQKIIKLEKTEQDFKKGLLKRYSRGDREDQRPKNRENHDNRPKGMR